MGNAIYAQSGGVTAVINASACGVIKAWRDKVGATAKLYAAENGIVGVLNEELIDTSLETSEDIEALLYTPGGAFGSCRYKLKNFEDDDSEYRRLIEVFKVHNVKYFFYNGGNDSADTCLKVAKVADDLGYEISAIHIPKTIDNDLVVTDNCPGFGSVAKYIAVSIKEAGLDLVSMCKTSTQVFILETMGRNAGWIAASSGIATTNSGEPPHIILVPEIAFTAKTFLDKVKETVRQHGYCVIVASEGLRGVDGNIITASNKADAFGHQQLGGVATFLVKLITAELNYKCHYAISDYLQRSARHIAAKNDVDQAYSLGVASVELALKGHHAIMPYILRVGEKPYKWEIRHVKLSEVANKEKFMPRDFINAEGFHITQKCRDYMEPLICGESYPPYKNGLPMYVRLQNKKITKKLS
jgi:6-phosphofructokinase 1